MPNRKEILETMEKTRGSVLIRTADGRLLHLTGPDAVPPDEELARGDPAAEAATLAELRQQMAALQGRMAGLSVTTTAPSVVVPPPPEGQTLPTTESVPQGGTARQEAPAQPVQQDDPRTATPDPDDRPQSERELPRTNPEAAPSVATENAPPEAKAPAEQDSAEEPEDEDDAEDVQEKDPEARKAGAPEAMPAKPADPPVFDPPNLPPSRRRR